MTQVALVIVYNHQYNQNIDVIERIYENRFNDIYHLVPFYDGDKKNVIAVYENSFYFQGYIAQGLKSYFKENYEHYFFVADDLILNPEIDQENYKQHLKLNTKSCFLPEFINLHGIKSGYWPRLGEAYRWNIKLKGVEAMNQLPTYNEAISKFQKNGLQIKPLKFNEIYKIPTSAKHWLSPFFSKNVLGHTSFVSQCFINKITPKKYHLSYPLVGSYSDIFVVSSDAIKQFCHYCGIFSATNLFVEVAIPSALTLSADEIVTEKDTELKGKPLWTKVELTELDPYKGSIKNLLQDFPKGYLYLHPIKLSKWNTEL